MTRSHAIPASRIWDWTTSGLTSSPNAFRESGAPTAAVKILNPSRKIIKVSEGVAPSTPPPLLSKTESDIAFLV